MEPLSIKKLILKQTKFSYDFPFQLPPPPHPPPFQNYTLVTMQYLK